jgi:hypothetical protein
MLSSIPFTLNVWFFVESYIRDSGIRLRISLVLLNYIELTDEEDMIVTEVVKKTELTDIFSVEYLEERDTRIDMSFTSRDESVTRMLTGNKKELRQKTVELLIVFIDIMCLFIDC